MSGRGDVVVRVRQIAEDRAAAAAAIATNASLAARDEAAAARRRAATHPLGRAPEALRGDAVLASLGMAAALRDAVTAADRRINSADEDLAVARQMVDQARSQRMAAERIAERRRAAWQAEEARRDQRTLDESALAVRALR
jgi:hypothetical protein